MIPGVCQKKGITYRRFRVKNAEGRWVDQYVRLPDPADPLFSEALARVNATSATRGSPLPGSMAALAVEFRQALRRGWSKRRRKKGAEPHAPATLSNYGRYIDLIVEGHGDELVAALRPANVFKLRDRMAETPGKANNWLTVLRLMMDFACERDWRADNPAARVPLLPIGEHDPWPAEVLEAALKAASPMLRLAIVSGLCSGQRVSDVIRMQHGWHDGRMMELRHKKTAVYAAVPMHGLWLAELAKMPRRAVTLLYDRSGKPFADPEPIQARIRRLMNEIGQTDAEGRALYTFHGLRKNACCYLLELGLSDGEVGAILGMSPETVRHYGKCANIYMIAAGAADRVVRGNFFPKDGERPRRAAKNPS